MMLMFIIYYISRLELDNIIVFTFGKDVQNQAVEIGYIIYIYIALCVCTLCMQIHLQALNINHFITNQTDCDMKVLVIIFRNH